MPLAIILHHVVVGALIARVHVIHTLLHQVLVAKAHLGVEQLQCGRLLLGVFQRLGCDAIA